MRAPWTGARILRLIVYGLRSDLCNLYITAITAARDLQCVQYVSAAIPHPCRAAAHYPPCTRPPDGAHWLACQSTLMYTYYTSDLRGIEFLPA